MAIPTFERALITQQLIEGNGAVFRHRQRGLAVDCLRERAVGVFI